MTDINQQKDLTKLFGHFQILFYHFTPFCFYLLIGIGIAVAR